MKYLYVSADIEQQVKKWLMNEIPQDDAHWRKSTVTLIVDRGLPDESV